MNRRLTSLLMRCQQLIRTGYLVLRERGIVVVTLRIYRWMRGERGYYKTLLPPPCDYETHRLQRQVAESIELKPDEAYPYFLIITVGVGGIDGTYESLRKQTWGRFFWSVITSETFDFTDIDYHCGSDVADTACDYVFFLGAGDSLTPDALMVLADFIQRKRPDMVYTDWDVFNGASFDTPFFKPGWSPHMLYCVNYLSPLAVFKRVYWRASYLNESAHGLMLRLTENMGHIAHLPRVLYHYHANHFEDRFGRHDADAVTEALKRRGLKGITWVGTDGGGVLPRWSADVLRVAIIIPNLNRADLLETCLEGLYKGTDYTNHEIIVVDTGSTDELTWALYDHYGKMYDNFYVVHDEQPFNFSRACNRGALGRDADVLLFLNNDIEIIQNDWLERMLQWLSLSEVGIVGAKLVYAGGMIQHGGVILGLSGLADHLFAGGRESVESPLGYAGWVRNYLAVTGACLMVRRESFEAVGGFDEDFELLFSDVDFCLRVGEAGWSVVYTPDARLIHHEASTHGKRLPKGDLVYAYERFDAILAKGDPFYHAHLSLRWCVPRLQCTPGEDAFVLLKEKFGAEGLIFRDKRLF